MAKKASPSATEQKIFVLDTSVIIYDHTAIKNFQEHDVVIPITVLEELDNFKKGNDTKNFAAREFTRYVDVMSGKNLLQDWTPINGRTHGRFKIEMHTSSKIDAEKIFGEKKADHKILNAALYTAETNPSKKVILVMTSPKYLVVSSPGRIPGIKEPRLCKFLDISSGSTTTEV